MRIWAIWDLDEKDWVRELPSKVDDGGEAILAFTSKREAYRRAAKHFGFDSYTEATRKGWCEVREITKGAGP